jgi:ribonuclease HI
MKYYADGYLLEKNPSPKGGGYSIVDEDNNLIQHTKISKVGFTNNEAEVLSIIACAEYCQPGDTISNDSEIAIRWLQYGSSKARKDLIPILRYGKEMIIEKGLNLIWESRSVNLAGHYNEDYDTAIPKWIVANRKGRTGKPIKRQFFADATTRKRDILLPVAEYK